MNSVSVAARRCLIVVLLFAGILTSPPRSVAAAIPVLIADSAVVVPSATSRIEGAVSERPARGIVAGYVYDDILDGYDGSMNLHLALSAGTVCVWEAALEQASGSRLAAEGAGKAFTGTGYELKYIWHRNGGDRHLPPGTEIPDPVPLRVFDRQYWQQVTGLTGGALVIYLIVSEGSRIVFPPRNLIPVP